MTNCKKNAIIQPVTKKKKPTFSHLKRLINPQRVQVRIGFRFEENKNSKLLKENKKLLKQILKKEQKTDKTKCLIRNPFLFFSKKGRVKLGKVGFASN